MAGGKLTPRQKMINLMYLVFIAMLALNMSKEVLTAFGNFNDKFSESNRLTDEANGNLLSALNTKAADEPAKYAEPAKKAKEVAKLSKDFVTFLETVKAEVTEGIEPDENGKLPFEAMDKSTIDEKWFAGDGYSPRGKEIVAGIDKYVSDIKKILGSDVKYIPFIKEIEKKFSTADITNREGIKVKFLDYKTKGFPAVSTLTFITAMQNDVKNTEAGAYNLFLGNALKTAASMKNFQAIVVLEKNAYFQGETVNGY
jgi:gliding motility-associated protein GldM